MARNLGPPRGGEGKRGDFGEEFGTTCRKNGKHPKTFWVPMVGRVSERFGVGGCADFLPEFGGDCLNEVGILLLKSYPSGIGVPGILVPSVPKSL